ncbi:condensation domain-containing protein [Actinoplanes sp. N902-109]|uniref:condensation domain-containing protein n=1 Tax=Actinoplanes sp. (strain N902-109) TaxID=649831 RepID=UPI00032951D6|nr:condensation domain-containing protein [Actinoplanes sp. N902-109]AGL16495.1 aminotransferase [Actinoplanes sp. N902-109]
MIRAEAPVTVQQETMLTAVAGAPRPQVYNVATRIRFAGHLDVPALADALDTLIGRHVALRSRFAGSPGDLRQQEIEPPSPVLRVTDLRDLPGPVAEGIADDLARAMAERPFDLTRSTVPVCRLLRFAAGRADLILVTHHITTDGWALALVLRELAELYRAATTGTPIELPDPGAQSTGYARWQKAQGADDLRLDHWRQALEGVDLALPLPTDRPRPATPTGAGGTVRLRAAEGTRSSVERLARARGVTPFIVAAAALAELLSRFSGRDRVLLSVSYAQRERREFESMVTCTRLAIGLLAPVSGSFDDVVDGVAGAALQSLEHPVPLGRVLDELGLAAAPVGLAFQNFPDGDATWPGLSVTTEDIAPAAARGDAVFGLTEAAGEYQAFLEYSSDLWTETSAERLLSDYLRALRRG